MENIKSTCYIYLAALNATIGGAIFFGYNLTVLNTMEDKLATHFK